MKRNLMAQINNNLSNLRLHDYFYYVLVVSFLVLPLVVATQYSKREPALDVFVVEPGDVGISIESDDTELDTDEETTVNVNINTPESFNSRGLAFQILIPDSATVSEPILDIPTANLFWDEVRFEQTGGNHRISVILVPDEGEFIQLSDGITIIHFTFKHSQNGTYNAVFRDGFEHNVFGEQDNVDLLNRNNLENLTLNVGGGAQVEAPTFQPTPGTFSESVTVNASTTTSGATIRYTTNGSDPTESSPEFPSAGVNLTETTTLKARAYLSGNSSSVTSGTYEVTAVQNQAPSVNLTQPENGDSFSVGSNIVLEAEATDSDGTVSLVEFYNGTTKLGNGGRVSGTNTYRYTWSNVGAGTYSLKARATDNEDATRDSSTVSINVSSTNQAPSVTLTAPANGSSFTAPANLTLTATATDSSDGTVAKVEFYNGTTLLNTDTTTPYSYAWNNVAAGTYALSAKAYDNDDAVDTSSTHTIVVSTGQSFDYSKIRGLNISNITFNGRSSASYPKVFVGLWRPRTNAFLTRDANNLSISANGAASSSSFFNGNGNTYTIEQTDVLIIKPDSYLSKAYTLSNLQKNLNGDGATYTLAVSDTSQYVPGDALQSEGSFDVVNIRDYVEYRNNVGKTDIYYVDYNGDGTITTLDYAILRDTYKDKGSTSNYPNSVNSVAPLLNGWR
jgi:hypothetical protein